MIMDAKINITKPKEQLSLYGYENYFNIFKNLYEKNNLPNTSLLSGPKGIGKSTFIYHFANFLLSEKEDKKYSFKNYTIDSSNLSFNLIKNNTHPNFYLLDNSSSDGNIKIEQTRNLLKFLNKTSYYKKLKIVLIDNAELLNSNSSNAMLKAFEEPSINTHFFIINNEPSGIIDTIKSRCIKFKFHFSINEKRNIFKKIANESNVKIDDNDLNEYLYYDTPGNFLKYLSIFSELNLDLSKDLLPCILFLLNEYKTKKEPEILNCIVLSIENFYNKLSLTNSRNINNYIINKNKILYLINDMKKFNLEKKNLIFTVTELLKNER